MNAGLGIARAFDMLHHGSNLYVAAEYGFYRKGDRSADWVRPEGSRKIFGFTRLAVSGNALVAGTHESGMFRSTDQGDTWNPADPVQGGETYAIFDLESAGRYLFALTSSGIFRSDDGGVTWSPRSTGLPEGIALGLAAKGSILFAWNGNGVYRSDDDGDTWLSNGVIPSGASVREMAFEGDVMLAAAGKGLYRFDDLGKYWRRCDTLFLENESYIVLESTRAGIFAGTAQEAIRRSVDGGVSWTSVAIDSSWGRSGIHSLAEVGGEILVGAWGIWSRPKDDFGKVGVVPKTPRNADIPRARLPLAIRLLERLGVNVLGRSTSPGAPRSP